MTTHFRHALIAVVLPLVLATPALAAGPQDAGRRKVQEVIVSQSASGEEVRGQLLDLSSRSVSMLVNNQAVEIPIERILRIDVRGDSVKNGAIIGALVVGGWCALVCGEALEGGAFPIFVVSEAGLGALIGAGIDAGIKGRTPIYIKPKAAAAQLVPAARGVSFRVRF
jgi:hypothetical protein